MATVQVNAQDNSNIDILTVNEHDVIDQAYSYSGGFKTGQYLVPHAIEKRFGERKQFSYYVNLFAPVVDAIVRPVFDSEQLRITENEKMKLFIDNCDNRGTSLQRFMRKTATELRKHSSYFIIMDNVSYEAMPDTNSQVIESRAIPYIFGKKPQDVEDSVVDRFGRIVSITFDNGKHITGGKEYCKYLRIDNETFTEYYEAQVEKDGEEVEIEIFSNPHGLGSLPVIMMIDNTVDSCDELIPEPKMYGLMRIVHAIFNKLSEMRELERKQEFAIFVVCGEPPSSESVGAGIAMFIDNESKFMPAFVSPPSDTLLALASTNKDLVDNLYRAAEQNGVIGVSSSKSGVAMAFEFSAMSSKLLETSEICEDTERRIADMFFDWINEKSDYVVEYDKTFSPTDETGTQKWVDIAMTYDVGATVKGEAIKLIAQGINPSVSAETLAIIDDEQQMSAIDASKNNADMIA